MPERKKEQISKRKRPKECFEEYEGLFFHEEFIEELEQTISEEPIFIGNLVAWFK